jgi:type II secretory pathway component PulC
MRFEVHLILWVTAAAAIGASLFVGSHGDSELSSSARAAISLEQSPPAPTTADPTNDSEQREVFPDINTSARSLFTVSTETMPEVILPGGQEMLPVLIGVFASMGRLTAMVIENGGTQTTLVQEGALVGGFVVQEISMDGIVLENSADGAQSSILLRGAGELP